MRHRKAGRKFGRNYGAATSSDPAIGNIDDYARAADDD